MSSSQHLHTMYLGSIVLPILICIGWVAAAAPAVARQEPTIFLFGPQPTTFDWWPFDDLETSLVSQPSFTSSDISRSPVMATPSTSSSSASALPSPSIIDITAIPPAATNAPHPQTRTKQNLKSSYLAPVFGLVGLLPGALAGWLIFRSYERWVAKSAAVALLPGPAYIPVERADEKTGGDRGGVSDDVEGSPSKHTRHGTTYSSYSVGRGFFGRTPSSKFYKPLQMATQERTKPAGPEKSFAWPSLPGSSRPASSHSRATTTTSAKSMETATMILDDPFASTGNNSTGTETKSQSMVVASRTSTRSTFAHASRFGEMWSGDEEDQDTVVVSSFSPTPSVEGGGEVGTSLLKIRSKSKSTRGKKRDEELTSGTSKLASPVNEASRKSSWNFPWIPGSPSVKPDSYTAVPARTSSPHSQSFRTPESSPRKPSYTRASEQVRFVDTSILPASPPTLTSPRLETEFFLTAVMFDVPGTPTPKRTRPFRFMTGLGEDKEPDGTDALDEISLSPHQSEVEHSYESHTPSKRKSRPGPSRGLSTASVSTISEFPGNAPPKRTPAERFYARHSALDKVEEIIQRSRSQTSVANATASPEIPVLGTVEDRRFGYTGKEFESGGIEQRLFES